MAPLIRREVEEDSIIGDPITSQESLQKMLNKISSQPRDLDVNIVSRDNYKLKQKVFRNTSHYFSKAQDVSSLKRMNYEPEIQKLFRKRQKSPQEIEYAQKRSESLFDIQTQKLAQERKHHRSGRLSPSHTGTRESWNNMSEIRHELSDTTLLAKDYLEKIAENTYGAHKRMYGPSPTQLSRIMKQRTRTEGLSSGGGRTRSRSSA